MSNAGTPPGWYPDPENPGQNRYWDGASWAPSGSPTAVSPGPPAGHPSPGGGSGGKAAVVIVGIVVLLAAIGGGVWALTSGGDDEDGDGDGDEVATDDEDRDELVSSLVEDFNIPEDDAECVADGIQDAGIDFDDIPPPDESVDFDSELAQELTDITRECIEAPEFEGGDDADADEDDADSDAGDDPDGGGGTEPDLGEAEELVTRFVDAVNAGDAPAAIALACSDGLFDSAVERAIDQGESLALGDLDEESAERTSNTNARWDLEGSTTGVILAINLPDRDWCVQSFAVV